MKFYSLLNKENHENLNKFPWKFNFTHIDDHLSNSEYKFAILSVFFKLFSKA